jgi:hypothetical protein
MAVEKDRVAGRCYVEPGELSARERGRDREPYVRVPRQARREPIVSRDAVDRTAVVADPHSLAVDAPPPLPPATVAPAPVILPSRDAN